jgi:hypothetical protein
MGIFGQVRAKTGRAAASHVGQIRHSPGFSGRVVAAECDMSRAAQSAAGDSAGGINYYHEFVIGVGRRNKLKKRPN